MARQIDLCTGWPSRSLLPAAAICQASQQALSNPSIAASGLLYGPDEGHSPLRKALAEWLGTFYGATLPADRFAITGGASQNLACILQVYSDPNYTANIFFVAPTYMRVFRIFVDNGFEGKLVAVPEDEEGIDILYLRHTMDDNDECSPVSTKTKPMKPVRPYSKYYRNIIYCVPTFSNPSSRIMSLDRRVELVRLAREKDALIVCDDVYDHLQWRGDPGIDLVAPLVKACLPRVVDIDRLVDGGTKRVDADGFGNTVSNGSFSKICGPGLRVGWAEGTPKFVYGVSQTGSTHSGGAPSQLTSTYMSIMLENGTLQNHIHYTLQPAYAARYRNIMLAIEQHLCPLGIDLPQHSREIVGGYFVWLHLPGTVMADDLTERCQVEASVCIVPGHLFEVPGDKKVTFPHHVRLCFSWIDQDLIVEGVKLIAQVLKGMMKWKSGAGIRTFERTTAFSN